MSIKQALKDIRYSVFNPHYYYCPVCRNYFHAYGSFRNIPECPLCYSLDRHRLSWIYMERKTDLFTEAMNYKHGQKRFLDLAPKKCIEERLRTRLGKGYMPADMYAEDVDIKMDITDIKFEDQSFDAIHCSHVLEHVMDDKKAISELRRILKIGGWAIIMVPIIVDRTIEDSTITDPNERLRLFGQEDHVRAYGPDFKERLEAAGFIVDIMRPSDILKEKEMIRMQIIGDNELLFCLFFCRRAHNE